MVYRFTEALACKSLLLALKVIGVNKYFTQNTDFIEYQNLEDAVMKARYFLANPNEAQSIAQNGCLRVKELIFKNCFWKTATFNI